MDDKRGDETTGGSNRGESARELVTQSMYHLVRLARLGLQAATSGVEKLEQSMARRQQERTAEPRPMGEAPPTTTRPPETPSPMGEAGEGRTPGTSGSQDPGQSRH